MITAADRRSGRLPYMACLAPALAAVCSVLAQPAAADPCWYPDALQVCAAAPDEEPAALPGAPRRSEPLLDAESAMRLSRRWFVGKDAERDLGLVREGERSQFSITKEGMRFTLRF